MTQEERIERIREMITYIGSGRTGEKPDKWVSRELAEEIEISGLSVDGSLAGGNKNKDYYCIDLGACLRGMDEDGAIYVQYPVKDTSRNGLGNLQGGLMASLIDNAMGILVVPVYGSFLTMNLDINYFLPISKEFDQVVIKAEIVKPGKRTKYLRTEVFRSDGKLAALAGSNVMMVRDHKK